MSKVQARCRREVGVGSAGMKERKMERNTWSKRTRMEKLANVLFSDQADAGTRKEMADIAKGEGKRPPQGARLISDHQRGAVSPLGGTMVWPTATQSRK